MRLLMGRLGTAAATLAVAGATAGPAPAAPTWTNYDRPATNGERVVRDLAIEMSDGRRSMRSSRSTDS